MVNTDNDARRKIEWLLDNGVDMIKVALESGAIFQREIPVLSEETTNLIVRIAHGRGTLVSAHVTSVGDLRLALRSDVDDLAHMVADRPVPDSLITRIVKEDIYWVPTLELWNGTNNAHRTNAIENLRRFAQAGGKVALGTDYAGYVIEFELGMPFLEIELMQEAGMTPMEIITAATKNAACVCNLDRDLGTVEKGKIADLLVIRGNPLENLSALRNVILVVHNGVIIRDERENQQSVGS